MDKEKEEFCSTCHKGVNFFNQFLLLFSFKIAVPFGESSFASTILNQDEFDRHPDQEEISPVGFEREDFQILTHHELGFS